MKITTFNPQIITNNAAGLTEVFGALGFEKHHNKRGIGEQNVNGIVMKNSDGFKLDISEPEMQLPHDITAIRINVDDFDEAYELLISKGFKNFYGDENVKTPSARSAMLISPSGVFINLVKHIKEHN